MGLRLGRVGGHLADSRRRSASASSASSTKHRRSRGKRSGDAVGSRLRTYLDQDNGRDFNPSDPATSEGRMVDSDNPMWYMPDGDEPHMRRRRSGIKAREIRSADQVGRFHRSDFSVRASDERGHHKSLQVSMPEQMRNELVAICDSKVFPARNAEALARSLIYDGIMILHQIARQDGLVIPNSHPQHLEALAVLNRDMQATIAYDERLEQACEQVRVLRDGGYRNTARSKVHEVLGVVRKIPNSEVRTRWIVRIEEEFGRLMRGRPAKIHGRKRESAWVEDGDHDNDHNHDHGRDDRDNE